MTGVKRHIVSRHWTRAAARKNERRLERWLALTESHSFWGLAEETAARDLMDMGVPSWARSVRVEHAGRIRARWVVVAVG